MKTLYGLTKNEALKLLNNFDNDTNKLALLLYNKHKASSLERAIFKVKKLKKFVA